LAFERLVFRVHAIQRMFQRGVSETDVHHVLETGGVIQEYPEDQPYPSRLVLGWQGSRPIHVVVADDLDNQETIVITVYEPDSAEWEPDFRRKRR
jgi:hypothetical protein